MLPCKQNREKVIIVVTMIMKPYTQNPQNELVAWEMQ